MSKLTLPLLLILLVIWLIGATWWFNKKYDHFDSYEGEECNIPFAVTDGNFQTRSENSMIFNISDWEPTIPMQTLASLKSVALHLANSKDKILTLTGIYGQDELNNSDFDNNGLARADAIKNELTTYGAPEKTIQTKAYMVEEIGLNCGKIIGGVEFKFSSSKEVESTTKPLASNEAPPPEKKTPPKVSSSSTSIDFSPEKTYTVFYDENTFKVEMKEEIDDYFQKLADYLKANPKDRLLLMGHTDNVGSKDKHFNFGKYRARKLRDVLLDYGIQKRRIKTDSEGSSKPIGSNGTSEGRYQNRRVEISVIQR